MTSGQRPPSSPRGLSGFCFASSERREGFKGSKVQGVQGFKGAASFYPVVKGKA